MADTKLTQNMRFFKAAEVKKDYQLKMKSLFQDVINEMASNMPDTARIDSLVARSMQINFAVEELVREARSTPFFIRG